MSDLLPVKNAVETPARRVNTHWRRLASSAVFYPVAGRLIPWFAVLAAVLALVGLWLGFAVAPTDHQQGEVYRIIFIHVPAAWMSMFLYLAAAFHAAIGLVFGTRLSPLMSRAIAPTGALFTVIALWTGAAWGKPTWGAWWVWDARLTSELILLFLYLGYLALVSSLDDPRRGDTAGAILLLAGAVNVPIIYFSVQWWSTLHQGASIRLDAAPAMTHTMLAGLIVMTLACWGLQRCDGLRAGPLPDQRARRAGGSAMNSLQDHPFFLVLAYGVTGLLVLVEVLVLWQRCRRSANAAQGESP